MSKIIFLGTCSGTEPISDMNHSAFVIEKTDSIIGLMQAKDALVQHIYVE